MTAMFVMIILGATDNRAPAGLAPIAIGLALTLIHLISIPVTNTSVNPARSTGPALIVGGWAIAAVVDVLGRAAARRGGRRRDLSLAGQGRLQLTIKCGSEAATACLIQCHETPLSRASSLPQEIYVWR